MSDKCQENAGEEKVGEIMFKFFLFTLICQPTTDAKKWMKYVISLKGSAGWWSSTKQFFFIENDENTFNSNIVPASQEASSSGCSSRQSVES